MIERLTLLSALVLLAGSCGSPAMAATSGGEAAEKVQKAEKADKTPPARGGEPGAEKAPEKAASKAPKAAAACACDPAELTLFNALRARQKQLDDRERKLAEHEAVLGRIEAELSGRLQAAVADVQRIEEQAAAKVGPPKDVAKDCSKELAKEADKEKASGGQAVTGALGALPPRKAAAILAAADTAVATQVLNELGPEKSGAILATMDPATAAALVQRMTKKPAERESVTPLAPAPAAAKRGRGGKEGR